MKLNLKFKIIAPILLSTLIMFAVSFLSLMDIYSLLLKMTNESNSSMEKIRIIANLERSFGLMVQEWKNTLIRGSNPEDFKKYSFGMDELFEKQKIISKSLMPFLKDDEAKHLEEFIVNLDKLVNKYKYARNTFLTGNQFLFTKADLYVKGLDRDVLNSLSLIVKQSNENYRNESKNSSEMIKNTILYSFLALFIISIIIFLVMWFLSNKMIENLNKIVNSIYTITEKLKTNSLTMESISIQLSSATSEQAASIEETTSALEEINSMINLSVKGISDTEKSSLESQAKVNEGRDSIKEMLVAMNEINLSNLKIVDQTIQSNNEMYEIVKLIEDIRSKTKIINDIVFQTKILSFNASVEAARAGEMGKGFSVVAEEVGNLAKMSGSAAIDITNILNNSVEKVKMITNEMKEKVQLIIDQSKGKIEFGVNTANSCSKIFDEIVINVNTVGNLAKEISSASKEQAQGVAEISKSMNTIYAVTNASSNTGKEAENFSKELLAQADLLSSIVLELKTVVNG